MRQARTSAERSVSSPRNRQSAEVTFKACPACNRHVEVSMRTFVAHDFNPLADRPKICGASGAYVNANQKWMTTGKAA